MMVKKGRGKMDLTRVGRIGWMARVFVAVLAANAGICLTSTGVATAGDCPNESLRLLQPGASRLSDCRAYEQVSPTAKNGVDAAGSTGLVQASPSGSQISFFAVTPFQNTVGAAQIPSYLADRSLSGYGWSTEGLEPLVAPGSTDEVAGLSKDLSKAIVVVREEQSVPCVPTVTVCSTFGSPSAYVRDNATNSYQLLTATLEQFDGLFLADSTSDDSRILFETTAKLTADAKAGVNNLYEWDEAKPIPDRVSLVGVLPGGVAPPGGSFAGPGGPALGQTGGSGGGFYTQNTISENGARVFFSDASTGYVYVSEPESGESALVSSGAEPAYWRAATRNGDYVFYTEGTELYRYNVNIKSREQLTIGAEGVLGVLGIAETDGSYAYFVAPGKISTETNANGEEAETGAANLYVWQSGTVTFITRLQKPVGANRNDEADWRGYTEFAVESGGPSGGEKSARVTPSGKDALFNSKARLTSYNNNGESELYLYDAERPLSSINPTCVSCNPKGIPAFASPQGEVHLSGKNVALTASPNPGNSYLTHNLSNDGNRVFFQTEEALAPSDVNGQVDVYEWEREGAGSCERGSSRFSSSSDGCVYLISTGESAQRSYFGDASPDGRNVFFFTRQALVAQDKDNNSDLYDARVEGGIPAQNPSPSPAPCGDESTCGGQTPSTPSAFGVPPSTTFSGAGNLAPSTTPAGPVPQTAAQIRAKKLVKALKACKSRPKSKRRRCEATARKRYGPLKVRAKKANVGSRRP
jgi:hypothetical protein